MPEHFGIDVSHHNGKIDWKKVKESGKTFALMKCQYESKSHRKDETFEYNYAESGKQGIKRGVYIYIGKESAKDPYNDAKCLLQNLNSRKLEMGIWLDLEDDALKSQNFEFIRSIAKIYAKIFTEAGYFVGIYCNHNWYKHYISKELKDNFKFWIARYPKNDYGIYNSGSELRPTASCAAIWQYSSKGKVNGINGNVDLNVWFRNLDAKAEKKEKIKNPYRLTKTFMRSGYIGESAKWLQFELNRHGADLKIDGIFGQKTKEALMLYQKRNKLKVDGIFGAETKESLWNNI